MHFIFCAPPTTQPSGRPASQWGPGYSTEEDALARSRMQHGQEELRAPAAGGGRGHQEVDLGNARRGDQSQEQDFAVGSARDLSQRSTTTTTTQAERLGINSNIYSLYQGHLAGQQARQGQFLAGGDLGSNQQGGVVRQDEAHPGQQGEGRHQVGESPRAMEPDSSTEDPPTSEKNTADQPEGTKGSSVDGEREKLEKSLPNFDKEEGTGTQGSKGVAAAFVKEDGVSEFNKGDRMSSFTFNKNEKILNFNKDADRAPGYNKDIGRLISEASSSSIIPPALKKKRFSNSLLEQFGDLVKEEHMGNDFPLSVEINELDSSPESVSPPRAPPFGLSSPHSPLRCLQLICILQLS